MNHESWAGNVRPLHPLIHDARFTIHDTRFTIGVLAYPVRIQTHLRKNAEAERKDSKHFRAGADTREGLVR